MFGAMRVAGLLPALGIYAPVTIVMIVLRGLLCALQFAGGWFLAERRPQGLQLAVGAYVGGLVLTPLDVGLGLAPSPVYAFFRWQATAVYCTYAVAALIILARSGRQHRL